MTNPSQLVNAAQADIRAGHERWEGGEWLVGWNMPGYLPESEPTKFDSWHDAQAYLVQEINRFWDEDLDSHRIHVPGGCHAGCPDRKWLHVETALNAAARDEPWSALTGDASLVLWITRYEKD